jgi:acetolactate synthase I/II/III large subunit
MTKLSDFVVDFVVRQGVKHVFMLTGGGAMHLNDSVGREPRLAYVCNLHEQACSIAADAYAQYTNGLAVALVTTGPGVTNAMTGVAAAWLDSTPLLILSGQVKRADLIGDRGVRQMGFQELETLRLVSSITKYAATVLQPETVRYHLEKAVYLAQHGRPGPVWVEIPLDVQAAAIDERGLASFDPGELASPIDPPEVLREKVSRATALLAQSERPVLLVGNGVRLAGAQREMAALIAELQVPVLLTWKAADLLPDNHPLYCGRPGASGQRGANFTQQNADLIVALGARLDYGQLAYSHENFARGARKVMVDIDPAEIGKMRTPIDMGVVGDAKRFLEELLAALPALGDGRWVGWLERCKRWQSEYPICLREYWGEKGFVNLYVFLEVLGEEMTGDDLLVPGSSGACSEVTFQAFRVKEGQRLFNSQGLGSMGFGVPAALGGCIAAGERRTVCVEGDGGFNMNLQELETVKRLRLPIKFFVLENNGYGSIRGTQRAHFGGRLVGCDPTSGLTLPDTLAVASAYGLATASIRDHSELRDRTRWVLQQPGPVVCSVRIPPDQITAPRVVSKQGADGAMVSSPLEDMWPYLGRDEFRKNMLVPPLEE